MLNRVGAICGIAGLVISAFAWFGIKPEDVGQAMYGSLRFVAPVMAAISSALAGWSLRGTLAERKAARASTVPLTCEVMVEPIREAIRHMPLEDRALLKALNNGATVYAETEAWFYHLSYNSELNELVTWMNTDRGSLVRKSELFDKVMENHLSLLNGVEETVEKHHCPHGSGRFVIKWSNDDYAWGWR